MKTPDEYWGDLVAEYLGEVERALARVNHPRSREVLDDLRAHLGQRYNETRPEERTLERLQELIQQMEAPEAYAELLAPDGRRRLFRMDLKRVWRVGRWVLLPVAALVIVVTAVRPGLVLPAYYVAGCALFVAIAAVLFVQYRATREQALLWLGAALVAWPLFSTPFGFVLKGQVDKLFSGAEGVWLWPFTLVARGQMNVSQALVVTRELGHVVWRALMLVALLKISRSLRARGAAEPEPA